MPKATKLTDKKLARMALKTLDAKKEEPITGPNQLMDDVQDGTEKPVKRSKLSADIRQAEKLLEDHRDKEQEVLVDEHGRKMAPNGLIYGHRREVDYSSVLGTSIDKHVESMRYKIVWVANKLADELIHETSKKTKKDKEYIKGLVWSFGTMYDKLANISTDTVQVHIPTKLLEGVKSAISIQIARVQSVAQSQLSSSPQGEVINVEPRDVTPATEPHVSKSSETPLLTEEDVRSSSDEASP